LTGDFLVAKIINKNLKGGDMSAMVTILEPTAEIKDSIIISAPAINDLSGKVISFVSNEGWHCLPFIWQRLRQLLLETYKAADTFNVPVPLIKPAPLEAIDEVTNRAQAAIVGICN
jgi:hypothetical protein